MLTLSLLPKNHMLCIASKQCACSRRVHIEGHMNRLEFLLSWTIIPITIVLGLFLSKNHIFCSITRCNLHFMKVSTENDNNFGYEKITILVDNIPLIKIFSVHLVERFQRRRLKCEKQTDDGRQVMAKGLIAFGKVS